MSIVPQPPSSGGRLVLHGPSWEEYTQMLRAFARQRGVRLTYDRGVLEIKTHHFRRYNCSRFLGRLIAALTEELNLPIASGGSTTLRRRRRQRGVEPDECFWIANEPRVRSIQRLNLRTDPPPDLAVEVDVTRSGVGGQSVVFVGRLGRYRRLPGTFGPPGRERDSTTVPRLGAATARHTALTPRDK
jgi:Uma2 family endonuclease